jgi:hypothetical protein
VAGFEPVAVDPDGAPLPVDDAPAVAADPAADDPAVGADVEPAIGPVAGAALPAFGPSPNGERGGSSARATNAPIATIATTTANRAPFTTGLRRGDRTRR